MNGLALKLKLNDVPDVEIYNPEIRLISGDNGIITMETSQDSNPGYTLCHLEIQDLIKIRDWIREAIKHQDLVRNYFKTWDQLSASDKAKVIGKKEHSRYSRSAFQKILYQVDKSGNMTGEAIKPTILTLDHKLWPGDKYLDEQDQELSQ